MQYKILILTLLVIATNVLIASISFKTGYNDGFADARKECNIAISNLTSRKEQEVIHEILGKYTGDKTDNNSYDFNAINKLFQ